MSETNKQFDIIVAELIMRVSAMEQLLVKKNLLTTVEIDEQIKIIANQVQDHLKFNAAKTKN